MITVLKAAALVVSKDLRIEARTGEVLVTTGLFAALVAVLASLSFYIDQNMARGIAPGVLWITGAFAGVLSMGRVWARERDHDAMRGLLLAPIPRSGIYLGKAAGSFIFLAIVEILLVPIVALLFHIDIWPVIGRMAALLALGTLGFVAAGTLFAAMGVRTGARDLVLSIVLFPLVTPALLAGVVATRELFGGATLGETLAWMRIISAFDIVFLASGVMLFGPLNSD